MTLEQIAKKYVHGLHDALTDRQEIKDMMTDIETYAESYHQAKLKLLGIADVVWRSERLPTDIEIGKMVSDLANIADDEKER